MKLINEDDKRITRHCLLLTSVLPNTDWKLDSDTKAPPPFVLLAGVVYPATKTIQNDQLNDK